MNGFSWRRARAVFEKDFLDLRKNRGLLWSMMALPAVILGDMYAFEQRLSALHPDNRNIRPKIRQQLQVLRDLQMLSFSGGGNYARVTP